MTATTRAPRPRVPHLEVLRLVPMVGVVATHTLMFTQPAASTVSNAALMFLHANREIFFFVSAFVLVYSSGAVGRRQTVAGFWRRRYPLVAAPYLAWTLLYWLPVAGLPSPSSSSLNQLLVNLTTGWFHLYFLLVTMQLYLVFPLLAWLIRRTSGHHGLLLAGSLSMQIAFTALMQYASGAEPGWLRLWLDQAQVVATSYQLYFLAGGLAAAHLPEVLRWLHSHRRVSLLAAAAAAAAVAANYALNLDLGQTAQAAANVFQPAVTLAVAAGLVLLFWAADALVNRLPADGRAWRALLSTSRTSFGVYLGHMVPLQVLLLTPLAATMGVSRLPAPLRALAVLTIVLGVTIPAVLVVQHTPLSAVVSGRRRSRAPRIEHKLADLLRAPAGGRRRPSLRRHSGEPESPAAGAPVPEPAIPSPL